MKAFDYNVGGRRIWSRISQDGQVLGFAIWHMQNFTGSSPLKALKGLFLTKKKEKRKKFKKEKGRQEKKERQKEKA